MNDVVTGRPFRLYGCVSQDESGEYSPVPGRWEGTLTLRESAHGGLRILLEMSVSRVSGKYVYRGVVRTYWYQRSRVEAYGLCGKAKTLREIERKVQEADLRIAIHSCLRNVYDPWHVTCLYRREGDALEPLCSTIDPLNLVLEELRSGEYVGVELCNDPRKRRPRLVHTLFRRMGSGASASSYDVTPRDRELARYWVLEES